MLAVVGRNGMGKTTLCNAITGLVPARAAASGSHGEEILGCSPQRITAAASATCRRGGASGPRSRSTSICAWPAADGARPWTVERIYQTFPRLAERRRNGGARAVRRRAADAGHRAARCSSTRRCS